jgi:dihydropteroate synthase
MDGGAIIDIGGYSTRPNAAFVSQEEEITRLSSAIELIIRNFPEAILSVDTFRANVASFVCKNYNIPIINDVGGGMWDEKMFETIAEFQPAYILMHTSPSPETMTTATNYSDLMNEIIAFFAKKISELNRLNINNIIIDPGFGFAKNMEQNYVLLKNLTYFEKYFDYPLLVGISRKSMIQKVLDVPSEDALNGTTALNMMALTKGGNILRVHDVKEAVETVKIFQETTMFS